MSGILCDYEIVTAHRVGNIKIEPFNVDRIQPNSYDVSLDGVIMVNGKEERLPYTLKHGEFILASTQEKITLNKNVCAEITGKSTLARKGVCLHLTAGFIDCGFSGNITLEMVNHGNDIELKEGDVIGQIIFFTSTTPLKKYDGHYQNQEGVTPAYDSVQPKKNKK